MNILLHNRRKYTQEQPLPSGGGVWADFDLSKLGSHTASAQPVDPTSYNAANQPLMIYDLHTMPDDSLLIAANSQGHVYVWGFAAGHEFDLMQVNSLYTTRTQNFTFYSACFSGDGMSLFSGYGGDVARRRLAVAYNLGTVGNSETVVSGSSAGIAETLHYIFFSGDGKKLFYKSFSSSRFYCLSLESPWAAESTRFEKLERVLLSDFNAQASPGSSTVTWNGFTFSPDGKVLVATTNRNVVKFVLSTPWELNTMAFHSAKELYDDVRDGTNIGVTLGGVAINAAGTKMIVHNRADGTRANAKFYGYDLVA